MFKDNFHHFTSVYTVRKMFTLGTNYWWQPSCHHQLVPVSTSCWASSESILALLVAATQPPGALASSEVGIDSELTQQLVLAGIH